MSLNEEDVRRIVRTELAAFLGNVVEKLPYGTHYPKIEDTMINIVETISREEAAREVNNLEDRLN
jgi:hypothetical protein